MPYDSGAIGFQEFSAFSKIVVQRTGQGTGYVVTVYGTIDRDTAAGIATGSAAEWQPIPSPSTEAANQWSNPLTDSNKLMAIDKPFAAIRFTITAASGMSQSGTVGVQVYAAP